MKNKFYKIILVMLVSTSLIMSIGCTEIYKGLLEYATEKISDEIDNIDSSDTKKNIITDSTVKYYKIDSDGFTDIQIENAIAWAKGMQGVTWSSSDDKGYYNMCLTFCNHAYVKGNDFSFRLESGYGDASVASEKLKASKNYSNEPAPRGSWVFYRIENNPYGHVGISLGEGNIIHCNTNVDEDKAEVLIQDIHFYPENIVYIGWAWPRINPK